MGRVVRCTANYKGAAGMAPLSYTYEMNGNGIETGRVVRDLPRTTGRRPLQRHVEFN